MSRKNTMQAPSRMGRPKKLQRDYHTIAFNCPLDVLAELDAEVKRYQATSIARVGRSDVIRLILQQALLDETAPTAGNGQGARRRNTLVTNARGEGIHVGKTDRRRPV